MSFEPLQPRNLGHVVDVPVKPELDWRKLYIESLEHQIRLAGAFRNILLNPERIEEAGDSLGANLARLQDTLANQIMQIELAKEFK